MHFQRMPWCEEARMGLARTFIDEGNFSSEKFLRERIDAGKFELWRIDGHSWAITQTWEDQFFLWCYQGRNLPEFVRAMVRIARKNGIRRMRYATRRPGMQRLLREFSPICVDPPEVFEIGVSNVN